MADGRPNTAGYGFGWFIGRQNGRRRVGHGGAWQGFASSLSRYPDDEWTVVVLANLDAAHARVGYMAHVVAGLVVPSLLPPRLTAIEDDDPSTAARVRLALDRLSNGRDLSPLATSRMAASAGSMDLVEVRSALSTVWPDAVVTLVERQAAVDGIRLSLFRLVRNDQSVLVAARLDAAGLVDSLRISPDREYR